MVSSPEPMVARSQLDWSPDDLRAARAVADTGQLRVAADLCEEIRGDDRGSSVLRTRVLALIGSGLSFEPARRNRKQRRAARARGEAPDPILDAASEDWWHIFPETELEDLLTWLVVLGVALAQLVWTEKDPRTGQDIARIRNGRNVPRIEVWHPRCLRFDVQGTRKWYARMRDGNEIEIQPGDGQWILLTAGGKSPWLRGLWRGLGPLWLLKKFAQDDLARAAEKYAQGIIGVTGPSGCDPEERDKLCDDIVNLGREGVIGLPEGFDAKVIQLNAGFEEIYLKQIALSHTSMAITAVGSDLPTESKGGVGTGATLQGQVRQDYLEADAGRAETELREQGLCPWTAANFVAADKAPWPCYAIDPADDLGKLATTWKTVLEGIRVAHETSVPIDVLATMQRFDMPVDENAGEQLPPFFAYDYAAGIPTINEARERRKLPPVTWGDQRTTASNAAVPPTEQKAAA